MLKLLLLINVFLITTSVVGQDNPMITGTWSSSTNKDDAKPVYNVADNAFAATAGEALLPYVNPTFADITTGTAALEKLKNIIETTDRQTVKGRNSFINKSGSLQFSWQDKTYIDCHPIGRIGDWMYYVREGCFNLVAVRVTPWSKKDDTKSDKPECDPNKFVYKDEAGPTGSVYRYKVDDCGEKTFIEIVKSPLDSGSGAGGGYDGSDGHDYTPQRYSYSKPSTTYTPIPAATPSLSDLEETKELTRGQKIARRIVLPTILGSALATGTYLAIAQPWADDPVVVVVQSPPPTGAGPTSTGTGGTSGVDPNGSGTLGGRYTIPTNVSQLKAAFVLGW